ncbi:MAG: PH domain-containing protein [Clostridia bacterium]|nr:PH domain-containing protein [Clostridia bacterium]
MFCSKCGNFLEDTAKFCDKCGNPTGVANMAVNNVVKEKIVDNEPVLVVKPKFKALYFMMASIITSIILILIITICSLGEGFFISLIVAAVILGVAGINVLFKKMQIKNMEYAFYRTKILYKDSFLNQTEKEVKYKHIREALLSRTVTDRIFGFGRIILFTNAESGFGNGILIPFVENSQETYNRIKDLLDD